MFNGFIIIETDINQIKNTEEKLNRYSKTQNLMLNIASGYLNPRSDKIGILTNEALNNIGNFISADRAYVYFYNFNGQIAINKYTWGNHKQFKKNSIPEKIELGKIKDFTNAHLNGELFIIKDAKEIKPSYLKVYLGSMMVTSMITLPLVNNRKCFGFVGFDTIKHIKEFAADEIKILKLLSQIFSNAFIKEEMESELNSTNKYLKTIIDHAPVFIMSFDKNYQCNLCNKHAEDVFGWTKEELNKCDDLQKLFFTNAGNTLNEYILKHNKKEFIKIQPVTRSGKKLDVMHAAYSLPDQSTIIIGYDITERIQYEKKILDSESRFKEFIETTKHIHLRYHLETHTLKYVSPSVKSILGYTVEEVIKLQFDRDIINKFFDSNIQTRY